MKRLMQRSDAALVRQTLSGVHTSFERLVERHAGTARALALAHVRSHTDAEDVVQEAFVEAFRCLDTLRDPSKFGAWLAGVVRHRAARVKERRKREAEYAESQSDAEPSVEPDVAQRELWLRVRQAVEELDADAREVVVLRYFAGKTSREIGNILDLTPAAVRKRLQRARYDLAERLLAEAGTADRNDQRSVKAIIGVVASTAPDWNVASVGAAGMLGLPATGLVPKAIVGCAIAVVLGGSLWYFKRPSTIQPPPMQVAEATTATDQPIAPTPAAAAVAARTGSPTGVSDAPVPETWPFRVYVIDENGAPQVDVPVTMSVTEFGRPNLTPFQNRPTLHSSIVPTNEHGVATFARIPAYPNLGVAYEIEAHTAERMGITRTLPGSLYQPEIESTLHLLPAESISGYVVDVSGRPIADATLRLRLHQMDPTLSGHVMSDMIYTTSGGDGSFLFPHVVRGSTTLAVQAPGYAFTRTGDLNTGVHDVRVEMEPGRRLEGTVQFADNGEPAPNVQLVAESSTSYDLWTTYTDEAGRFVFDSLSATEYALWSADPILVLVKPNERVNLARTDRARKSIKIARGGAIEGFVTDALTGAPLPDTAVSAMDTRDRDQSSRPHRNSQLQYRGNTDADGYFVLEGLPAGPYAVASMIQSRLSGNLGQIERARRQTDVRAGEMTTVSLSLELRREITGRVVDSDGEGMREFCLSVWGTNSKSEVNEALGLNSLIAVRPYHQPTKTGVDGAFVAYPPHGADKIYIRAHRPGWMSQTLGPITLGERESITVELGAQRTASIAGKVAAPIGNDQIHRVQIKSAEHGPHITLGLGAAASFLAEEGIIARDGRFFAGALYPGEYTLSVDGAQTAVSLAPGQHLEGLTLHVPGNTGAGGTVTGEIQLLGEPLRSASVSVGKQSDETDEDGRFNLVNVQPGRQLLNVHATQIDEGILSQWDALRPIEVTRGKTVEVDVALGTGTASISGHVLANGKPYGPFSGRVRLEFGDVDSIQESISVRPNSRGEYRMTGIPAGTHTIRYENQSDDQRIIDSIDVELAPGDSFRHDFHFSMGSVRVNLQGMQPGEVGRLIVLPSDTVESAITGSVLESLLQAAVIDKTIEHDGPHTIHGTFAGNSAFYFGAWDESLEGTANILANLRATSALVFVAPGETTEIALGLP